MLYYLLKYCDTTTTLIWYYFVKRPGDPYSYSTGQLILKEREDCMIFSIQQIALGSSESFLFHPINTIAQ